MLGYVANQFWAARLSRAESEKRELQGDSTTHSELGAETICETQHPKAIWETASPWTVTAVRASAVLFEPTETRVDLRPSCNVPPLRRFVQRTPSFLFIEFIAHSVTTHACATTERWTVFNSLASYGTHTL